MGSKELDDFLSSPDFSIESTLTSPNHPSWEPLIEQGLLIGRLKNKSIQYSNAKIRYNVIQKEFRDELDSCSAVVLVFAEAHFLLGDLHGCLDWLMRLEKLLPPNDRKLMKIIENTQKVIALARVEDQAYYDCDDLEMPDEVNKFYCPPPTMDIRGLDTNYNWTEVDNLWNNLKSSCSPSSELEVIAQFARLACVESNVIEGVFEFPHAGQTWPKLIKRGFFVNSIEGISQNSKVKKSGKIVDILNSTLSCLNQIGCCLDDVNQFNEQFIKNIHAALLEYDNIDSDDIMGYKVYRLIVTGRFRKTAVRTEHDEGTRLVVFSHPDEIDTRMSQFVENVRSLLTNGDVDPYAKCAWIQWAFLSIHPFEDGNGRVSRIISSIPLLKLGLPPVVVHASDKLDYFQALQCADEDADVSSLAWFLRKSTLRGIEELESLSHQSLQESSAMDGKTMVKKKNKSPSSSPSGSPPSQSPS